MQRRNLAATIIPTLTPLGKNQDDTPQINSNQKTYGSVNLSTGTFYINSEITPASGASASALNYLRGAPNGGTVLQLGNSGNGDINCKDVSNIELGYFTMQGMPLNQGVVITASTGARSNFYLHDINFANILTNTAFTAWANGQTLSNMLFERVQVNTCDYNGFDLRGNGTIINTIFYRCSTYDCGVNGQEIWTVGFCGADDSVTVNGLYYIACNANGAWESDWHFEGVCKRNGVVFVDCNAEYAGLKPAGTNNKDGTTGPQYGSGFLFGSFTSGRDDLVASNLTATGDHNSIADVWTPQGAKSFLNGAAYNTVFGRSVTSVTRITQGGCLGIDILNSSGTHDLILYANSTVSTQIAGFNLTLSDGKIYPIPGFTDVSQPILGITGTSGGTTYTVTTSVSPSGSGTVAVSPGGPYTSGETATFTATPASGYSFVNFVINGTTYTTNPCSVAITQNTTVVANFQSSGGTVGSFGYAGAGTFGSTGFDVNNFFIFEPGYAGANGTGVSMSALVSNSDTVAHNIQMAIYTLSGTTFTLVAKTGSISVPAGAAKGWVTGNLTTQPALLASQTYYLAIAADNTNVKFYVDSVSPEIQYVVGQTWGTWPATFATSALVQNWNVEMPITVNYTTGSSFTHGTTHTIAFSNSGVNPSGKACTMTVVIGTASASYNFTSTGALINFSIPIVMPAAGTYTLYIDLYMEGVLIDTYTSPNQIVVI